MSTQKTLAREEYLEDFIFGKATHDLLIDDEDTTSKKKKQVGQISKNRSREKRRLKQLKKAWYDPDDDVSEFLTAEKFKKLRKNEENLLKNAKISGKEFVSRLREECKTFEDWANIDHLNKEKSLRELVDKSGESLSASNHSNKFPLAPHKINMNFFGDMQRMLPKDVTTNTHSRFDDSFMAKFHPRYRIAFNLLSSGRLDLFEVCDDESSGDGSKNFSALYRLHSRFIQSIRVKSFHPSSFALLGNEVLFVSLKSRVLLSYDLESGDYTTIQSSFGNSGIKGQLTKEKFFHDRISVSKCGRFFASYASTSDRINIFSCTSKECVKSLFVSRDGCQGVEFTHNSTHLLILCTDGSVSVWDFKQSAYVTKFFDEGCVTASSFALSADDQYIFCGSSSGYVNAYSLAPCFDLPANALAKPIKVIDKLVTPATSILTNQNAEILFIASSCKPNAMKLLHCDTWTTFSNFPLPGLSLPSVRCVDFSPNSGYMLLGCEAGKIPIFRLTHYKHY